MTNVKNAINQLASDRATIGSNEEALGYYSAQLSSLSNNLSAAKSQITDVDVATESTNYAKQNILVQSGTAMLGPGEFDAAVSPPAPVVSRRISLTGEIARTAPARRPSLVFDDASHDGVWRKHKTATNNNIYGNQHSNQHRHVQPAMSAARPPAWRSPAWLPA